MFQYFSTNYWWSLMAMGALQTGGEISEIDEICRPLETLSRRGVEDHGANEEWFAAWTKMGHRLERLAKADAEAGFPLGAARKHYRAALYFSVGEFALDARVVARGREAYVRGLENFRRAVELSGDPVELVEIPYEDTTLDALFIRAEGDGPAPCVIHFGGADSVKEHLYLRYKNEFSKRGVSLLIVDHPGVGTAIRLKGLPTRADIEVAGTASADYLATRSDVDMERLGICAMSQGGYYAPRIAALEKRMKLCVVWGAIWDMETIVNEYNSITRGKLKPKQHRTFGGLEPEEVMERIKQMTLEGLADKIECPILVIHGENDQQAPLWRARKTCDEAINAPRRDLKVFTVEDGGAEHCQVDIMTMATDYIVDWTAQRFREMEAA
ncbi:alpha/beta hydrolase family protein [Conexibacter woesei]|uniref:Peptidase S9 prolyl oligopeptidase catalytic domain-containing protein n=1 Tax=Conexibacter woesei (strain DSM 14684 / CCUG 47730 / CIP 108061 / JCM 11494 / NBRC 100937 / ID131577) TaxID=469383 RepID=D3F4H1_CONWI|nr:alpha/beta hydrolase [Conexibacter woesei]ADB50543.1 protein of unknown function DUF1100 hydrolase family protein [Conexibacter woesei DSM 14684]